MAGETPLDLEEEMLPPAEATEMHARRERFRRNWAWFQMHLDEIVDHHAGKNIAISRSRAVLGRHISGRI